MTTNPNNPYIVKTVDGVRTRVQLTDEEVADLFPPPAPQDVRRHAAYLMREIAKEYEPEERETWPTQIEEARAVQAGSEGPFPVLASIAAARGMPISELAARVLFLKGEYEKAAGAVLAGQAKLVRMDPIPRDYRDDKHWSAE